MCLICRQKTRLSGISFDQGFDVFILSWKNPGSEDADLDLNDYLDLGVREPLAWLKEEQGVPRGTWRRLLPWRNASVDRRGGLCRGQ